jgi:FAD/FMN-containing dehydrogenase
VFSRRTFLRHLITTTGLVLSAAVSRANPTSNILPPFPTLPESEAFLLTPTDHRFWRYSPAYNRRTMVSPQLRAVCRTADAVSGMIEWLRSHQLPFAVRSGGHSFEGLSESSSVVVDLRRLNRIEVDVAHETITVGPGTSLGTIYRALASQGYTLPAGTCLTVAVAGHALGGGYGMLSRRYGLLCDSLRSLQLVGPDGRVIKVNAKENPDLFWAARGGGGGSLGIATQLDFQIYPLDELFVFSIQWALPLAPALNVVTAWQAWAPHAPDVITCELRIGKGANEMLQLVFEGQSVGSEDELRRELKTILDSAASKGRPMLRRMSLLQTADYFSEGWDYESHYSKDKSDFIFSPIDRDAIAILLGALQHLPRACPLTVTFSPFGGRIASVASQDTAFPYRNALCCLHYEVVWERAELTLQMLAQMRSVYTAMRPYVSGAAYVNYCDKDLANWRQAYWGPNLPRLQAIKAHFDPENLFRHDQSI